MIDTFIEVTLDKPENFLKVRETLTRMGVASHDKTTLYQSAHILHKKGHFYIVHFKQMFALDGKPTTLTDEDQARTNTIANLLAKWGLVKLVDPEKSKQPEVHPSQLTIIRAKDKDSWTLVKKYDVGRRFRGTKD